MVVARAFLRYGEQGLPPGRGERASPVEEQGLWAVGSPVPGPWNTGSVVTVDQLSCPSACGIFPDQGSNPCLLRCQADSLPLSYQRNLPPYILI